jgi:hypothetical protein
MYIPTYISTLTQKMHWATFWALFTRTHLVTLAEAEEVILSIVLFSAEKNGGEREKKFN